MRKIIYTMLLIVYLVLHGITTTKINAQQVGAVKGNYNYLFISVDTFKNLKKDKYVFQYFINNKDELTMHGWQAFGAVGRVFNTKPEIELEIWKEGKCSLLNTYMGAQLITRDAFKQIRKNLTSKTKYIVFVPECEKGTFIYSIQITDDELKGGELKSMATPVLTMIGVQANPSPPKRFY